MSTAPATIAAAPRRRRSGISERRLAAYMVSPSLIVIAIVAAYPIAYAIWLSLHQYSVITPGLSRWGRPSNNYTEALGSSEFWCATKTTFLFTVISVSLELVIGLGMALLMHQAFRGRCDSARRRARPVGGADGRHRDHVALDLRARPRIRNQVLQALHLPGGDTVWLGQDGYAMAVLIIADVWKTAPFMALLILAGLQVISDDVYDAAKVDGARAWQRFARSRCR